MRHGRGIGRAPANKRVSETSRLALTKVDSICRAWFWSVMLVLFAWCFTSTAAPSSSVLVLVRSLDQSDPAPYELRLRSEISTEGIVAIVVNPHSGSGDTKALAAKFGANTTVDVSVSATEVTAAIWTADPAMGLEVNRNVRVSTRERDAVAVFALRTVDFLQGARIELEQQRQSKMAADAEATAATSGRSATGKLTSTPATTTQNNLRQNKPYLASTPRGSQSSTPEMPREERNAARSRQRLRVGMAYTILRSSDEFLWSTAGQFSLAWHWHPAWALGVAVTGPYINYIRSSSDNYEVTVDQELVALSLRRRIPLGYTWDIEPYLAMGGARYSADATAKPPRLGYHATAWSVFSSGGASVVLRLGDHLRFVANVELFGRWQTPSTTVNGRDVSGSSRWNLVIALGPGWAI